MADQIPDVGGFIREQRRLAELSVRRLAEMSGVSNPYLSQIERGLRRPSADILANIARGLQISAESLYIRAGILDGDIDPATGVSAVESSIRHAAELTPDQRKALLGVYRSFVSVNLVEQGTRGRRPTDDPGDDSDDEGTDPDTPDAGRAGGSDPAARRSGPRER